MKELIEFVAKVSDGNPGCMEFMTEALARAQAEGEDGMRRWLVAFQRAEVIGLIGGNLYVVWADACGRDVGKAVETLIERSAGTLLELGGMR